MTPKRVWDSVKTNLRRAIALVFHETLDSIEFEAKIEVLGHETKVKKPPGRSKEMDISIAPKGSIKHPPRDRRATDKISLPPAKEAKAEIIEFLAEKPKKPRKSRAKPKSDE